MATTERSQGTTALSQRNHTNHSVGEFYSPPPWWPLSWLWEFSRALTIPLLRAETWCHVWQLWFWLAGLKICWGAAHSPRSCLWLGPSWSPMGTSGKGVRAIRVVRARVDGACRSGSLSHFLAFHGPPAGSRIEVLNYTTHKTTFFILVHMPYIFGKLKFFWFY